jgi:hypothetical protein
MNKKIIYILIGIAIVYYFYKINNKPAVVTSGSLVTIEPWRDSGNADRTGLTYENPWKAEPHEGYPNGKRWVDGHWSAS